VHVRNRIESLWREGWLAHGGAPPVPSLSVEKVVLRGPEDADGFLSTAARWLFGA
jgi:hypothetical protein